MKALETEALSYRYGDGTSALCDVTFFVSPGEKVGVIGPNGAGKSTLLLHFNGLLPETLPENANVHLFGTPVSTANLKEIRSRVGMIFQDPDDQLFCPTVREDVAFGPGMAGLKGDALDAAVDRAMSDAGVTVDGGRNPHRLSKGEKRRVCIAGVLACSPKILVLDEPTSDLDPRGRRELKRLLCGMDLTMIISSHDLGFISDVCQRLVVMDGGKLVADGPTEEILGDSELLRSHGL